MKHFVQIFFLILELQIRIPELVLLILTLWFGSEDSCFKIKFFIRLYRLVFKHFIQMVLEHHLDSVTVNRTL